MATLSNLRLPIAVLALSAAGLVGIVSREGYTDRAVIPVKGDVPTMGFGSTTRADGSPVKLGDRTDAVHALVKAQRDVTAFEGALKKCVRVPLSQTEYDVYVDLAYNIGSYRFCHNSEGGPGAIPRRLNAGDYRGACDAILLYRYGPRKFDCSTPGNRICWGVWERRLEANQKCLRAT